MKIIRSLSEMKAARAAAGGSVGFVPTMGCLHKGHMSLVELSKKNNTATIVSIFVNPTQFGPREDFAKYPRNETRDIAMMENVGVNIAFLPQAEEIYPDGFDTWVEVKGITDKLEGAARLGHFRGVTTVCSKLFNIVQPDRAYFGQKDAQQVLVIKKMVSDLNLNLEIITGQTQREPDGLAMSSRNMYLNQAERRAASVLCKALEKAAALYLSGEHHAERLKKVMAELIVAEPLANMEYISIANTSSLHELELIDSPALVSLAVRIGRTRLIDNILLAQPACV
ncbi:MAG: pantoate--beta-alanine ligase [Dehalococcoidia bacterium]|nr:pantoate--beta-alanine ligase [Dehalococcoidia bacterium]